MPTTRNGSILETFTASAKGGGKSSLVGQYVSDPLVGAQTIAGTVKGIIQAKESNSVGDVRSHMIVKVMSNDGQTQRGVLLAPDTGALASEWPLTMTNRKFPKAYPAGGAALSSVNALDGDRIVVEIGFWQTATTSLTINGTIYLGAPNSTPADLVENETDTALGVPWVEFSQTLNFTAAPDPGPAPAPLGTTIGKPRAYVDWRVLLCDLNGSALANITRIARGKQFSFSMNRPATFQFEVPSDNAKIATLHTDGDPLLSAKNRVIKAYRKEGQLYVLRFAGVVETPEDTGDQTAMKTGMVAFDPMHLLSSRLCRDSVGNVSHVAFENISGTEIARSLVSRTNNVDATGIQTTGGTFESTDARTISIDYRMIADVLIDLAESQNGFDMAFDPVDRTDGILVRMSCYANMGRDLPDVVFSYKMPPATALGMNRVQDGTQLANYIYGVGGTNQGGDNVTATANDSASITKYHRHEAVSTYSDVTDGSLLLSLIAEELKYRKQPKQIITATPPRAAEPWTHFWLGDTIRVQAPSEFRGGFSGVQRVYGITLDVNDEGGEYVSSVQVAAA